jgi:hypothetical protein
LERLGMAEQIALEMPVDDDRVAAALERIADQQGAFFRSLERQTVALEAIAQAVTAVVIGGLEEKS